ncbi:hypothetical protein Nepgr_030714 [Nepenthes gracilis]|uniref:BHLH domain-containing protein n=1 Tax=Nepenthes gracilis TaxID=150966 RepID=A0AAD3TGS0_NEPGR|nr:hypothetical protein Nepgr_030714 [Nepenthes gracilis]
MATGIQNNEGLPEDLRKQLAAAVRSIQWSYAIFWSISSTKQGVLEWGEGYYNGDIKTRKIIQAIELDDDLIGLQRSEQLRNLYESLLAGESTPQARRISVALSPEDLTNTEWYYLVCMSFVFNLGQGLPGRTLLNGQAIWLCNAHYADSRVFSRSLLAKSASVQTVVCFPMSGGVLELGVTDLVAEDLSLIHHVKTFFFEVPQDHFSNEIIDTMLTSLIQEGLDSPSDGSNGFRPLIIEDINGESARAQSWQLIDDELSNCVLTSLTSSDCISQTALNPENVVFTENAENAIELQDQNREKMEAEIKGDDFHYHSVLSSLFKTSHQSILRQSFGNFSKESSFVCWKKGPKRAIEKHRYETQQKMLKKLLYQVPRMHTHHCLLETEEKTTQKDVLRRSEADGTNMNIVLSRRRRETVNERFLALKTLIPSISKADRVSILDDTISYLKELEKRVEELESFQDTAENQVRPKTKPLDISERTSDNYDYNNKLGSKRKTSFDIVDERIPYNNVFISTIEKGFSIEIRCPWRESLLLEIMHVLSDLHLSSHSIQSSTVDGILSLTIRFEVKALHGLSTRMIKQALQRVLRR